MNHDDDAFMAQFNQRLQLEPPPQWTMKRQEFPWLELGWAFAAALLLGMYWTELRFGIFTLHVLLDQSLSDVPISWICVGLGAAYGLFVWLAPRLVREI